MLYQSAVRRFGMRKLQNELVDLNQVIALTLTQAKMRYNVGENNMYAIADQAGANIYIGPRKRLYSREKLDEYFAKLTE